MTIEQILRVLKEVNNTMYINREQLLFLLISKKYNILIKKALKKNDLNGVKKILWEVYEIYNEYSPKYKSGTLLYILKINKQLNLLELKPFLEYLKDPLKDYNEYNQKIIYLNQINNDCRNSQIFIPSIEFRRS